MERTWIFAYGSNMDPERMLARVPGAVSRGRARLAGHRLVFNKRGRDGSAKANLAAEADAEVWGVVWEIAVADLAVLDPHEGGYARSRARVEASDGARVEVELYVSDRLIEDPVPYDWYLEHVLRGARAHGLPGEYVARLEAVASRPDTDGDAP
jgi:cation transport regulator ChaC